MLVRFRSHTWHDPENKIGMSNDSLPPPRRDLWTS